MISGTPVHIDRIPIKQVCRFTVSIDQSEDGRFSGFVAVDGEDMGHGLTLTDRAACLDFIKETLDRQIPPA